AKAKRLGQAIERSPDVAERGMTSFATAPQNVGSRMKSGLCVRGLGMPRHRGSHRQLGGISNEYFQGFCNGPGGCQVPLHSRDSRSAGFVLLSGVGALAAT